MNEPFSDELISAFLDGELTADEQSLVEQTLMDSVEHRQVFEELRALRGSLQALPVHKLPADFSQRVLRRAEEALKDETPAVVSPAAANSEPVASERGESAVIAAPVSPAKSNHVQFAVMAFAALAAALLVALYLPKIEVNPVAVAPTLPERLAVHPAENTRTFKAQSSKPPDLVDTTAVLPKPAVDEPLAELQKGLEQTNSFKEQGQFARDSAKSPPFEEKAEGGPAKGGAKPADNGARRAAVAPRDADFALGKKSVVEQGPNEKAASPAEPAADITRRDNKEAEALLSLAYDKENKGELGAPELLVVRVPCTRAALEAGAVDAAFRKYNILFDDAAAEGDVNALPTKELADLKKESRQLSERALAEGVDVIYVEAAREQIDGVLRDFQSRPDRFLGVASQPLAIDEYERSPPTAELLREKLASAKDARVEQLKLAASDREAARNRAPKASAGLEAGRGGSAAGGSRAIVPPSPAGPGAAGGPSPAPAAPAKPGVAKDGLNTAQARKEAEGYKPQAKADALSGKSERPNAAKQLDADRQDTRRSAALLSEVEADSSETAPAGRASRIATAPYKEYARMDFRRLRTGGEAKNGASPALEKSSDDQDRGSEGEESKASKKRAEAPADAKPTDKLGKFEAREQGEKSGELAERGKRLAAPAGQERVRVLFVIKAVDEE